MEYLLYLIKVVVANGYLKLLGVIFSFSTLAFTVSKFL